MRPSRCQQTSSRIDAVRPRVLFRRRQQNIYRFALHLTGSPAVADVIDTGVGTQTPSQLIAQSDQEAQPAAATFDSAAVSVDTAPEVETSAEVG